MKITTFVLAVCCLQAEAFNTFRCGGTIRPGSSIALRKTARITAVRCAVQGNGNQEQLWDRRTALAHFSISQLALFLSTSQGKLVSAGSVYQAVADEVKALIQKTPDFGPTLVRLAWHSRSCLNLSIESDRLCYQTQTDF